LADRLTLTGLRGQGRHGVFDWERESPRPFVVDLVLHVDMAAAAAGDDLTHTVDYGALASGVVARIEGEPVRLIETLAERIAADCLADTRVRTAEVTVHKPHAPIAVPFGDVAVTIVRSRA
jgi:dihydroneopterin aldolase